jgi:hypothetical protein
MTERQLIGKIGRVQEDIELLNKRHKDSMAPVHDELYALTQEYSRLYSPLKAGDKIEYTPYGGKHTGVVEIIEGTCTLIPDKWQYEAKILSVGEEAPESDKKYIGRTTVVYLNRDETPKPLRQ